MHTHIYTHKYTYSPLRSIDMANNETTSMATLTNTISKRKKKQKNDITLLLPRTKNYVYTYYLAILVRD